MNGFTLLAPLGFLGFGQYISEASCHAVDTAFYTPLRLGPLFPNDVKILKPNVGLGPNQMKIDLRKVFVENITYFWKNKSIFGKERPRKP